MATKTLHFVAAISEEGIPIALCVEHDLVTQADTMDELQAACEDMVTAHLDASEELQLEPWNMSPPPDEAEHSRCRPTGQI